MAIKKQKGKSTSNKKKTVQHKIDGIKLEAHVAAVKSGKHVNVVDEIKFRASTVREAMDETIKWAKKVKLGSQTQKFADLLVDGIAIFLANLVEEKSK